MNGVGVAKQKGPWTIEVEYGHGIAIQNTGEVKFNDTSYCHFALISTRDTSDPRTIKETLKGERTR